MTSGLIQNIRVGRGTNFPSEKLPWHKGTEDNPMAQNIALDIAVIQPTESSRMSVWKVEGP